jgi:hypothetical protein
MMIAMLIAFTIGGQNFERYEPMPDLATCWQRAPERMNALLAVSRDYQTRCRLCHQQWRPDLTCRRSFRTHSRRPWGKGGPPRPPAYEVAGGMIDAAAGQ